MLVVCYSMLIMLGKGHLFFNESLTEPTTHFTSPLLCGAVVVCVNWYTKQIVY